MLKGETFNLQTFTSDAFALFVDRFMDKQCGVMKGCDLSNTNNSITIDDGYFLIRGRFLKIISGVTVDSISTNGFYSLVCEIDLSKVNTVDQFNQGVIKTVYNATDYPTLTQQDITEGGTVYQYEFARFKVEDGVITNVTDRRTYVDYGKILTFIQQELSDLESESNVSLKTDFGILTGSFAVEGTSTISGYKEIQYPAGFSISNCVVIANDCSQGDESEYVGNSPYFTVERYSDKLIARYTQPTGSNVHIGTNIYYKIVLFKIV